MKKIMYSLTIAISAFCLGCGQSETDSPTETPTPSTSEYKDLLEKRASSPSGAKINIRQEVGKFENASSAEKHELYETQKSLAR